MAYGYRVFTEIERPSRELVARLEEIPTPDLGDAMQKAGVVDPAIRPIYQPMPRFAGPAVTVSIPTGSYIIKKMALDLTRPGDVLVIAARRITHHALLGGNLGTLLKRRGVAGAIVDGAIRDPDQHQAVGFPIHARGPTVNAGPNPGPGEVNVPVAVGDCVIFPGDIVVADNEGIVAVPPAFAEEILRRVAKAAEGHARSMAFFEKGEVAGIAATRKELEDSGCEFVNNTWSK